ncbi:MAG: N-acetylmuramoyl-L-alanine amidase [Verrucomicrobia bacterium]|nr:N-acetylmuramoyl-L-alanine amidase [Verrucomicrobiota bacterium]
MKTKSYLMAAGLFAGAFLLPTAEVVAQTTPAAQPSICNRACWSARSGSCTTSLGSLNRAIIHHTAGPSDYTTSYETGKARMRANQNYHMDSNGWCDLGYHFCVNANGDIYEGRAGSIGTSGSWKRGAHDGCNANSMGFTALGYYHTPYNHTFTTALQNGLAAVIAWRMPSGWSASGSSTYCGNSVGYLDGHYKVKATACPGTNIINGLGALRTNVANRRTSGGTSKTARTVDNNAAGFSVVGSWSTGTSATDKHGADYRFKSTAPVSEPATWATSLNTSASWTVRAWWPAGSNRSSTAPYIVSHGGGTTTVNKNQQVNGGSWQTLGTWSMGGSQNVKLSCWTTTGYVVMADAVRWE